MKEGRSNDAIREFLLETVVAPCVKQLRARHGADAVGEVLPGGETNAAAWYGQSARDRSELEQLWARIWLAQEGTAVELPLGNDSMSFDEVVEQVERLFDCIDAWYAQSGTGWGQQIEIEWSPGFTRAGWDRAVSLARGGTEGCDSHDRDQSWPPLSASGWVSAWNDARSAFAEHQSRLAELIGRRLVSAWVPVDRSNRWVPDLPVVVVGDDGAQLEICWTSGHELSLSWNTVDLDASRQDDLVRWDDDVATFAVALTAGAITDVALVNFPAPRRRYVPGRPFGLAIVTGRSAVTIYSGFDGPAADYEMSWTHGPHESFEWVSVTSPPA